jgi:hypothetical protein
LPVYTFARLRPFLFAQVSPTVYRTKDTNLGRLVNITWLLVPFVSDAPFTPTRSLFCRGYVIYMTVFSRWKILQAYKTSGEQLRASSGAYFIQYTIA